VPAPSGLVRQPGLEAECSLAATSSAFLTSKPRCNRSVFCFGLATAQDRLFQLDVLRHKARGQLAEILAPPVSNPTACIERSDWRPRRQGMGGAGRRIARTPGGLFQGNQCWNRSVCGMLGHEFDCSTIVHTLAAHRQSGHCREFRWYLTGGFRSSSAGAGNVCW